MGRRMTDINENCPNCGFTVRTEWSWTEFWIGKLHNSFIAWVVSTLIVFLDMLVIKSINGGTEWIRWVVWGVVTVSFIFYKQVGNAIYNAQLKLEMQLKAGINKELGGS